MKLVIENVSLLSSILQGTRDDVIMIECPSYTMVSEVGSSGGPNQTGTRATETTVGAWNEESEGRTVWFCQLVVIVTTAGHSVWSQSLPLIFLSPLFSVEMTTTTNTHT